MRARRHRGHHQLEAPGEDVVAIGLRPQVLADVYYFLIASSWRRLFAVLVGVYLTVNAIFAVAYVALGDVIENARPGSFADAFFFSVQTMATVGYGRLAPKTFGANLLSTIEIITGMLGLTIMTGLVFAKFARPTARVLFSRVAVVAPFEGVPSLMFRMANARASQIVEAHVSVMMVRTERTREGDEIRRVHDLRLRRAHSALFALTWTAIHPMTPESPLYGLDPESLRDAELTVTVSFTGYDESLAASVHARATYGPDEIRLGHRFRDLFVTLPDGQRAIDYRRFHEIVPLDARPAEGATARGTGIG